MKRVFSSPFAVPLMSLATVALLFVVGQGWSIMHANRILDRLGLADGTRVDVEVYIGFEPERFHLEMFQDTGRYLGWQGDHVLLLQADPDDLRALARKYWIDDVRLHEAGT